MSDNADMPPEDCDYQPVGAREYGPPPPGYENVIDRDTGRWLGLKRARQKPPAAAAVVYYFTAGPFVKIGYAQNFAAMCRRLRQLQTGCPFTLGFGIYERGGRRPGTRRGDGGVNEKCKTVTVGHRHYQCPLSESFRRHTAEEAEAIRQSVAEHGILNPVRLYFDTDGKWPNAVLDGEGRLEAAVACGLTDIPTIDHGAMSRADAYELAKSFNDARRHDDPAEVRRRRIEAVNAKRAEGKTIRTIADELDIHPKQVQRDLEAGVDSVYTSKPETVTGRDGKTYPATVNRKGSFPFGADPDAAPDPITDNPLPDYDPYDTTPADDGGEGDDHQEPATAPPPAGLPYSPVDHTRARNRRPPHQVSDPTEEVLTALTTARKALTKWLNSDDPSAVTFARYAGDLQKGGVIQAPHTLVSNRHVDRAGGKKGMCLFDGFVALRFLIRLADKHKNLTYSQLRKRWQTEAGADGGDE